VSQADVEVVRAMNEPNAGKDMIAIIAAIVDVLGPDFAEADALAFMSQDPAFQHLHPQIEWQISVPGQTRVARGPRGLALFFADWLDVWERYTYRAVEYRDLGDGWVLMPADLQARGRSGIEVAARLFQLFRVREGKVRLCRVYMTEQRALDSVTGEAASG
jgi:hypothetical protein